MGTAADTGAASLAAAAGAFARAGEGFGVFETGPFTVAAAFFVGEAAFFTVLTEAFFTVLTAAFFTGFFAAFRAAFLAARFTAFSAFLIFRAAFFAAFFAFFFLLTTIHPSSSPASAGPPDHTIGMLARGKGPRVTITPKAGGVTVAISALAGDRRWRLRMAAVAAAVAGAALLGSLRLERAWEAVLRRGDFGDLPLPLLLLLSLAVLVSAPLALVGLAALAFAEESIDVGPDDVTIRTTVFEKTHTRRIPMADLDCWRETLWPLAPWWTWAVTRLAARSRGRLHPIAGAAGPKEKRAIGRALACATGKPLIGDRGRPIG